MNVQISGHRTALTSIQLITKAGAASLPDKAQDVNDLRWHLFDVWVGVKQSIIDNGIGQGRSRLHAYIRGTGGHFEYSPWNKLAKTLSTVISYVKIHC